MREGNEVMREGAERQRSKEADRQNRQTGNEIPSMAARDFAAKHATRTRAAKRESARQRKSERVAMQCRDIDIDRDNKERECERERDPTAPAPSARRKSPAISTCLQPQFWHNFGILMRNPYLCCLFCQKTKKNKQNRERMRE